MPLFFAKERPEASALFENTNSILADLLLVLQDSTSLSIFDPRPEINIATLKILANKENIRVLECGELGKPKTTFDFKKVSGGLLVQDNDIELINVDNLKCVTTIKPSDSEMHDLIFAWKVAKSVKSNAIVYAKEGATVGIGAGQMSRVDSSEVAAKKAKEASEKLGLERSLADGSVVASDAFFPFSDGLLTAVAAGARAVIQPGGSVRDNDIIAAANDHDIAMVMTGMRHFRH